MSDFNNWITLVDFAWIGLDDTGNVGLFFPKGDRGIPSRVRQSYTADGYSLVTCFILDELPVIGVPMLDSVGWARRDAERGLFSFEYDDCARGYRRVSRPMNALRFDSIKDAGPPFVAYAVKLGGDFTEDEWVRPSDM